MRASTVVSRVVLSEAQRRIAESRGTSVVTGGPGCGKTTALAAFAAARQTRRGGVAIVVSQPSGAAAFCQALSELGQDPANFSIGLLGEHVARWMRNSYARAGANPRLRPGAAGATRAALARAARGLLEMSWPMFARRDINLDVPYLSRPEAFLDEAAVLFGLLQRSRISPEQFEEGCAIGLRTFYGEGVERARVWIADAGVRDRASRRGKAALFASVQSLTEQRKAERDLAAILQELYREYRLAAGALALRAPEDLIDSAACWLTADSGSAADIAKSLDAVVVDDAEDAEPGAIDVLEALRSQADFDIMVAGCEDCQISGLQGRRSALRALRQAQRDSLAPLGAAAPCCVERFADEASEIGSIVQRASDLLATGAPPESIALLTRGADTAALYARALQKAGLPALMPSSMLQRPAEMGDLFALAAVIDDPLDEEHLLRLLSSPVGGLSDASIRVLCRDPFSELQLRLEVGSAATETPASNSGARQLVRNFLDGAADGCLSDAARACVDCLREKLASWRAQSASLGAAEKLAYLARAAGFRDAWNQASSWESARLSDDVERVVQAAARAGSTGATQTVGDVERLLESDVLSLHPARRHRGAIVVDAIVAVKGLRFDHVIVAGIAHERFPRIYTSHGMAFSRKYGLIVRENVAAGAAQTAKFAWYYALHGAKGMYLDEERRALRYALSRARVGAYATGYGITPGWARGQDLLSSLGPANGLQNPVPQGSARV